MATILCLDIRATIQLRLPTPAVLPSLRTPCNKFMWLHFQHLDTTPPTHALPSPTLTQWAGCNAWTRLHCRYIIHKKKKKKKLQSRMKQHYKTCVADRRSGTCSYVRTCSCWLFWTCEPQSRYLTMPHFLVASSWFPFARPVPSSNSKPSVVIILTTLNVWLIPGT